MIIGQAAGVAARMAIQSKSAVQDIDTKQLTETLLKQGATMRVRPGPGRPTWKGFQQTIRN